MEEPQTIRVRLDQVDDVLAIFGDAFLGLFGDDRFAGLNRLSQSLFRPCRHGDERVAKRVQLRDVASEVLRRLEQGFGLVVAGEKARGSESNIPFPRKSSGFLPPLRSLSFNRVAASEKDPVRCPSFSFCPAATACCDRSADRSGIGRTSRRAGCDPIPPFHRPPSIEAWACFRGLAERPPASPGQARQWRRSAIPDGPA